MENSCLHFRFRFIPILLITLPKKGISVCDLQREIGHKRDMTICPVMHSISATWGKWDDGKI